MGRISIDSLKGRLAEVIVEELFLSMGFDVFRYGMENTLPGFANRHLPKIGFIARQIRFMPDYIISKGNRTFFVEVKYRTGGNFNFGSYCTVKGLNPYPYPYALVVLVSREYIKAQYARDLLRGKDFVYLHQIKYLDVDLEVVRECVDLIRAFFASNFWE